MERLMWTVLASFGWGVWPLIANYIQKHYSVVSSYTTFAALGFAIPIVAIPLMNFGLFGQILYFFLLATLISVGVAMKTTLVISITPVLLLYLVGIVNGIGVFAYVKLFQYQMSREIPIVLGIVPIIIFIGSIMLFNESFNWTKTLGALVVVIGIYLLNQN